MKYFSSFFLFKICFIFNNFNLIKLSKNYLFFFFKSNLKNIFVNNVFLKKKNIFFKDLILIKLNFNYFFKKKFFKINLPIIFEDNNLIILNKTKNILIHPVQNVIDNFIINNLLYYYGNKILKFFRLGILHRLDKDSTGLMIFFKSYKNYLNLIKQIHFNILKRYYVTYVKNNLNKSGKIVCYIKKNKKQNFSETNYILIKTIFKNKKKIHLIKCNLLSGRTNQIKIHFDSIGNPLYIDNKNQIFLVSYYISFYHPNFNSNVNFIRAAKFRDGGIRTLDS